MTGTVLEGARVLLLEDDVLINFATSDALQEMGCRVSAYTRLQDALSAIDRELPGIAILDINIDGVISYEGRRTAAWKRRSDHLCDRLRLPYASGAVEGVPALR